MQLKIYVFLHYVCNICACLSGRERGKKEKLYVIKHENRKGIFLQKFQDKKFFSKATFGKMHLQYMHISSYIF